MGHAYLINAVMEFWNVKNLKGPPNLTIKYNKDEGINAKLNSSLQNLLKSMRCGLDALSDGDVIKSFRLENAVLKTTILQNIRHRTEKFFKVLKKVEKTCERWQELHLEGDLKKILQLMPDISSQENERILRIPSRQMLEYLVCRILGGFHLLLALDGYCLESARYLTSKISSGHFFATAMIFLATVARIRVLALDFAGQLAKLYDKIFPLLSDLKGSAVEWLPIGVTLPNALSPILRQHCMHQNKHKLKHHEKEKVKESKEVKGILSLFKNDLEDCREVQASSNQINKDSLLENKIDMEVDDAIISVFGGVYLEEDIGESCTVDVKKEKIISKNKRKHSITYKENDIKSEISFSLPEKSGIINKKKDKINKKVEKNYKKVKKLMNNVNSFEDFGRFLITEKKKRSEK